MMSRWISLTLAAAVVAGLAVVVPTAYARKTIETPSYTVESEQAGFEVRRYAPRIVAEVVVEGDADQATNAGFRILADFIFGNNRAKTEIAMTAPVDRSAEPIAMTAPVDRSAEGDAWVVAFTMPSKYTLDTLPEPNDARVKIRQLPSKTYAVLRFSGAPSERKVQRKIDEFVQTIEAAGLARSGAAPTYARYDPPWTLGFLRRNEIFVELALD
ncbi:SOUL family heme-binding protein [Nannocystaceae bacterium ST9]